MRLYGTRKKNDNFSFEFWIKDNWPELVGSTVVLIAFMMILVSDEAVIDIQPWLDTLPFPGTLIIPAKRLISLGLGLGITEIVYLINKKKKKWVERSLKASDM